MKNTRNTYGKQGKDLYGVTTDTQIIEAIEALGVRPIFLLVAGSQLWGMARPDSDLDIHGIYIKPTDLVLSLYKGEDTIEMTNVFNKDIEIKLYEVEKAFKLIQAHNGNILTELLAPTVFYDSGDVEWFDLARKHLTKRLIPYYRGFHASMKKRAGRSRGGKAITYAYMQLYQGIYLMKTGKILHDFNKLKFEVEKEIGKSELLDYYMDRNTWYIPCTDDQMREIQDDWKRIEQKFISASKYTKLKENYDAYSILNNMLLDMRYKEK